MYSYSLSQWLRTKRDVLYTMWIQNFIGELGEGSRVMYPCSLQGGGKRRVMIGKHTVIQSNGILGCWEHYYAMKADGKIVTQAFDPIIVIGNNCILGENIHITAVSKITIGDGLLTGRYVYIGDNAHGGLSWDESKVPPSNRHLLSKGGVTIGRNVWIGDKTTILGGVTIGDNVIIGANSVVLKDIPSNCMAAGVPARVLKTL